MTDITIEELEESLLLLRINQIQERRKEIWEEIEKLFDERDSLIEELREIMNRIESLKKTGD